MQRGIREFLGFTFIIRYYAFGHDCKVTKRNELTKTIEKTKRKERNCCQMRNQKNRMERVESGSEERKRRLFCIIFIIFVYIRGVFVNRIKIKSSFSKI